MVDLATTYHLIPFPTSSYHLVGGGRRWSEVLGGGCTTVTTLRSKGRATIECHCLGIGVQSVDPETSSKFYSCPC